MDLRVYTWRVQPSLIHSCSKILTNGSTDNFCVRAPTNSLQKREKRHGYSDLRCVNIKTNRPTKSPVIRKKQSAKLTPMDFSTTGNTW